LSGGIRQTESNLGETLAFAGVLVAIAIVVGFIRASRHSTDPTLHRAAFGTRSQRTLAIEVATAQLLPDEVLIASCTGKRELSRVWRLLFVRELLDAVQPQILVVAVTDHRLLMIEVVGHRSWLSVAEPTSRVFIERFKNGPLSGHFHLQIGDRKIAIQVPGALWASIKADIRSVHDALVMGGAVTHAKGKSTESLPAHRPSAKQWPSSLSLPTQSTSRSESTAPIDVDGAERNVVCGECNAVNSHINRYCKRCGANLPALKGITCASCGRRNRVQNRFCTDCGAVMTLRTTATEDHGAGGATVATDRPPPVDRLGTATNHAAGEGLGVRMDTTPTVAHSDTDSGSRRFCRNCGVQASGQDRFCKACGEALGLINHKEVC
jgi:hypothetical protein